MSVTFYATVDADSIRPYMPADVAYLLPASSFARKGLRPPKIPSHVCEVAADCGGFVATVRWGDYRYTDAEYVAWLASWPTPPSWAATMDYCCEPEITGRVVLERQDRTTEQAWRFWLTHRDRPWVWVPTVQGWDVDDYREHARDLKPLVRAMAAHYGEGSAFRVGIGTLCRRASVGMVRDVTAAVREILPGVGLHLWGVKLSLLQSEGGAPPGVVSVDSAAWNRLGFGSGKESYHASQSRGLTQREHAYRVALPDYLGRVREALTAPRTLPMLCSVGAA